MKICVVVTTYNRPDALMLALEGYLAQNDKDYELIVADDGSTIETKDVVTDYTAKKIINIKHVWHEDKGFRAAAIRNLAVSETSADYVIFGDGDCVPLPDFVGQHKRLAEKNWFVAGSRVLLGQEFTNHTLRANIPIYQWTISQWVAARLRKDVNRLFPFLQLPFKSRLRKLSSKDWKGIMTCNMAVWRSDIIKINGFDESYEGWGLEDSDIAIRLIRAGIYRKSARFLAPVLHLWHKENDRGRLHENQQRLDALIKSNRFLATKGVNRYLQ